MHVQAWRRKTKMKSDYDEEEAVDWNEEWRRAQTKTAKTKKEKKTNKQTKKEGNNKGEE